MTALLEYLYPGLYSIADLGEDLGPCCITFSIAISSDNTFKK